MRQVDTEVRIGEESVKSRPILKVESIERWEKLFGYRFFEYENIRAITGLVAIGVSVGVLPSKKKTGFVSIVQPGFTQENYVGFVFAQEQLVLLPGSSIME